MHRGEPEDTKLKIQTSTWGAAEHQGAEHPQQTFLQVSTRVAQHLPLLLTTSRDPAHTFLEESLQTKIKLFYQDGWQSSLLPDTLCSSTKEFGTRFSPQCNIVYCCDRVMGLAIGLQDNARDIGRIHFVMEMCFHLAHLKRSELICSRHSQSQDCKGGSQNGNHSRAQGNFAWATFRLPHSWLKSLICHARVLIHRWSKSG